MGNEQSELSGVDIDKKAVEISDYWSQHSASILKSDGSCTSLSVFIGELFVSGSLWSTQTPLEKCAKNSMIFRHPCMIKYVSSWQKNSRFYLAVEEVVPLSHVLSSLNILQISVGLCSILKALCFLHQNAFVSHNNICCTSIYVTKDGNWKLGGMEYLCGYKDMNYDYLAKTRSSRYSKSIDPDEDKLLQNDLGRKDFIDVYAFGVFVCEILKSKTDDEISTLSSFRDYCKNELQNTDISRRPNFKSLLEHEFFNHDFIQIHSFLMELPLKNDEEKKLFFQNLGVKLLSFDELVVASQLGGLLLSRLVLFNKTAQENLLPLLLMARSDKPEDGKPKCIFSEETFKQYLCPKLLEIFRVRDAQIRLLLLYHFSNFMHIFTCEELQSFILPELLVGIKDTNDHLVAMTLRTLADLVPILGAPTVIGGKRGKLFNDGLPTHSNRRLSRDLKRQDSVSIIPNPSNLSSEVDQISLSSVDAQSTIENLNELPERPRPDGEEGETSTEEVEVSVEEDLDNWEDWDINETNSSSNRPPAITSDDMKVVDNLSKNAENISKESIKSKTIIPDIQDLDIKNQLNTVYTNDFDFFQDMEPVIDASNKFPINTGDNDISLEKKFSSKLALSMEDSNEEGWEEEEWN
nr:protein-associating with the carboxyl-terminal domain of ezrin isoform X1 [Leptinotarsa decemlineata]